MALKPTSKKHAKQIKAGTIGRKRGHKFEIVLAEMISKLPKSIDSADIKDGNVFVGNPALNLIQYVMQDLGIDNISNLMAISPGTLATAGKGKKTITFNGNEIGKSKSDIILIGESNRKKIIKGISVKQCSNEKPTNAQLYFTTARAFCELLRRDSIDISDACVDAMRMFCGDVGFRPLDDQTTNKDRKTDSRRWFWEELPNKERQELEKIFTTQQDKITRLLLRKAYQDDQYSPDYVVHQTKKFSDIRSCEVAIYSIDELVKLSHTYGGFKKKKYSVRKGHGRDPVGVEHEAPRFGIIQMQRGGQKQHPSQLQFNLEAGYFNKLPVVERKKHVKDA
jgi:hypothetical protein